MTERLIPKRRRGGRRGRPVKVYDSDGLKALFAIEHDQELRRVLEQRGIAYYESAGRIFVSDYQLAGLTDIRTTEAKE